MSKVLVLGAGLVSGPLVRYLLGVKDFEVTVATRTVEKGAKLVGRAENGVAWAIDVGDETALEALIARHDLSISLLPYVYHPVVARLCVKHGKQMVTTSYVKDAMRALDGEARKKGVVLLNEIGVDPGIDHMSAMQVIDRIRDEGGTLVSFASNTGGLPAPDANDNPLGYKFSWAPRGVVLAGKNPARYLKDGAVVDVPGPELFAHHWPCSIAGFGTLEVYPNRDSLPYIESYGIPTVKSMFRGTLRYPGWCDSLKKIVELGLLDETVRPELARMTFAELTGTLCGGGRKATQDALARRLGLSAESKPVTDLKWLGFLSDEPLPAGANTYLDVLAQRMLEKMQYAPGERDLLIMQHEFIVEYGDRTERITSTLVDYGIPNGDTSMSRLVGLPAAIAARMILQGEIDLTGVQVPMVPAVYEPVLKELASLGVQFRETTTVV
ncbi:MAG: saccharopine dehydrogenase C-terminal domain-containing protein [Candidatus Bipolaricaulis sp.]|nr:saccharopine dehydrogenase C-terminal domain-containing protein [Candidatus Bipolaricaulis sp.]MDD5219253.1 saccharopine dehydrogenase C-terminal domain-containing protein [Candidatus Bipolaricaulis sp.]MDD5646541.1 saccharopine dehydrogenase C-terminal domain-containing protein [Candidatus Bipolaricaulis sp.]